MLGAGDATTSDVRLVQDAGAVPHTAVKQPKPSETSVAGAARDWLAKAWIDSLVNGRCDRHTSTGWPDSVVCTAATKGILLGEPRPALPPWTSPPR